MKRSWFLLLALLVVMAFAAWFALQRPGGAPAGPHRLKVITTLFPLYDMARYVGGERADVSLLLPPGVESHSFEPRPSDVINISRADVFVFTGRYMEPWAADLTGNINSRTLLVVDASRGIRLIGEGAPDPHIWLDFGNAAGMVDTIAAAFVSRDPSDKDYFLKRAAEYNAKLAALDKEYRDALAACRGREIVYGGHYAFGYLARRYGLKYVAAQGLSPDAEPTAADLARLVEQVRQGHIKYVFYEELTSPKIAETIASETGAKLLLLNAAHNVTRDQLKNNTTFFDIMESDLKNLKVGLGSD